MRGFRTDDLRRAVAQLRSDWDLPTDTEFHLLTGGYSHSNFRFAMGGDQYVVRMPGAGDIDTAHEHRMLKELPAKVTAPVIAYLPSTGHMLTRWVEGAMLVDADVEASRVAIWYRALRNQLPKMTKAYRLEERVRAYLDTAPSHVPSLDTAWDLIKHVRLSAELAPSHNDLNPWNVIVTDHAPNRWVTLDWESAGLNNPLFDVVTIHAGLGLDLPLTQFATLCESDATRDELHDVEVWFWLREYAWAADQLGQGNDRIEITDQIEESAAKLEILSRFGASG